MIVGLDLDEKCLKENVCNIWNSYIDWGVCNLMEYKVICWMVFSECIIDEICCQVKESFLEFNEMCQLLVKEIFFSEVYCVFGDVLFLLLVEIIIEFVSYDLQCVWEIIVFGFEVMWYVLYEVDVK